MLKTRAVLATVVCVLALSGTASAHPVPGGMSFGLYSGWFSAEDQKLRDLAAAAQSTQAAQGAAGADCVNGMAGEFPCQDVDLLGHLPLAEIGGGEIGNDMWGWTDPRPAASTRSWARPTAPRSSTSPTPTSPCFLGKLPTQSTTGGDLLARHQGLREPRLHRVREHRPRHAGLRPHAPARRRGRAARRSPPTPSTRRRSATPTTSTSTRRRASRTSSAPTRAAAATRRRPAHGRHPQPAEPDVRRLRARAARDPNNNYMHDTQCVTYAGPTPFPGREICFGVQRERRHDLRRHRQGATR